MINPLPDSATPDASGDLNALIGVYTGIAAIDGGTATIPKMLLRFAWYLDGDGQRLNDRQAFMLVLVIGLHDDFNLRLSNLPMKASIDSLTNDLAFLRKAGLVFTERDFHPPVKGRPPLMRSQIWDIRSLISNLDAVQRLWLERQAKKIAEWRAAGERGSRPVYEFPQNFHHKIVVPRPVLEDIVAGRFYPVPDKWMAQARRAFTAAEIEALIEARRVRKDGEMPTGLNLPGRGARTGQNLPGTELPTGLNVPGYLDSVVVVDDGRKLDSSNDAVFARFAELKGKPYEPSEKDRQALADLRAGGYSLEEIQAGMEYAFSLPGKPQRFTHVARVTKSLARGPRSQADDPKPQHRTTSTPTSGSLTPDDSKSKPRQLGMPGLAAGGDGAAGLPPELAQAIALYADITGPSPPPAEAVTRLKAACALCDPVAQRHGETGATWALRAMQLSLKAEDKLAYAEEILRRWTADGPESDQRPTQAGYRPPRKAQAGAAKPAPSQDRRAQYLTTED